MSLPKIPDRYWPWIGISILHFLLTLVVTLIYGIKTMHLLVPVNDPPPSLSAIADFPLLIQILLFPVGYLSEFRQDIHPYIWATNSLLVGFSPVWLRFIWRGVCRGKSSQLR
jgi:hypothetical protein